MCLPRSHASRMNAWKTLASWLLKARQSLWLQFRDSIFLTAINHLNFFQAAFDGVLRPQLAVALFSTPLFCPKAFLLPLNFPFQKKKGFQKERKMDINSAQVPVILKNVPTGVRHDSQCLTLSSPILINAFRIGA